MPGMSKYLEDKLIDHVLRNTTYDTPGNVYCGIFDDTATTEELEDSDLSNEITSYNGNRKQIIMGEPFVQNGKTYAANINEMEFVDMPQGAVSFGAIFDEPLHGNILFHCELSETRNTNAGDIMRVMPGDMVIHLD